MSEQNECRIVLDLMPSYVDGICSKESKEYIEKHIDSCAECKKVYDMMKADLSEEGFNSTVNLEDITIDHEKIINNVKSRMKKDVQKAIF